MDSRGNQVVPQKSGRLSSHELDGLFEYLKGPMKDPNNFVICRIAVEQYKIQQFLDHYQEVEEAKRAAEFLEAIIKYGSAQLIKKIICNENEDFFRFALERQICEEKNKSGAQQPDQMKLAAPLIMMVLRFSYTKIQPPLAYIMALYKQIIRSTFSETVWKNILITTENNILSTPDFADKKVPFLYQALNRVEKETLSCEEKSSETSLRSQTVPTNEAHDKKRKRSEKNASHESQVDNTSSVPPIPWEELIREHAICEQSLMNMQQIIRKGAVSVMPRAITTIVKALQNLRKNVANPAKQMLSAPDSSIAQPSTPLPVTVSSQLTVATSSNTGLFSSSQSSVSAPMQPSSVTKARVSPVSLQQQPFLFRPRSPDDTQTHHALASTALTNDSSLDIGYLPPMGSEVYNEFAPEEDEATMRQNFSS